MRPTNKGSLLIDGRDVNKMNLNQLRSQINTVLQNAFIIPSDTIRQNLDPRNLFSDQELNEVLHKAAFNLDEQDQSEQFNET